MIVAGYASADIWEPRAHKYVKLSAISSMLVLCSGFDREERVTSSGV